jgi:hypothetical protein
MRKAAAVLFAAGALCIFGAPDIWAAPSNTCARERTACLGANVQTGSFGAQYVPPAATERCNAAYQSCLRGGR